MEAVCRPAVEMAAAFGRDRTGSHPKWPEFILQMVSKRLTTAFRVSFWGSIVFILRQAASERADACTNHRISLSGLAPDEAEKIFLLAEILGWQARIANGVAVGVAGAACGADADCDSEAAVSPPRLVLRQVGGVIRAEADDPGVRQQLACQGLDRLVAPVSLIALEQLLMFAG